MLFKARCFVLLATHELTADELHPLDGHRTAFPWVRVVWVVPAGRSDVRVKLGSNTTRFRSEHPWRRAFGKPVWTRVDSP